MATSSFKSATRRSSIAPGDAASSTRARRSRSLSRFSGRFAEPESDDISDFTTPRGKFVNKTRGSGLFPEISMDDLADNFFYGRSVDKKKLGVEYSNGRVGRSSSRGGNGKSERRFSMDTEASRRRGRSVSKNSNYENENGNGSRQMRRSVSIVRGKRSDDLESDTDKPYGSSKLRIENGKYIDRNGSRQLRRSASVVRCRSDELESDIDKSYGYSKLRFPESGNFQLPFSNKQTNSSCVLRRSMSQKDLLQSSDNYSSHSSSLTDDDILDVRSHKNSCEKTIKTVCSLEKAEHPTADGDGSVLYEAMRNEVRHAVHEIRTELGKVMVNTHPTTLANDDVNQPKVSNVNVIAEIRRNYTDKLEQSEKRKQELLAELAAEEQHGFELTNIVRELLPASKQAAPALRPRSRRRSNDRTRMSKRLTEEAERYFEDFLSNVEETDMSSFDGEKSDTSSILGGSAKLKESSVAYNTISEVHEILAKATSLPMETDGVFLPWLEWETSNDLSSSPCKMKEENTTTSTTNFSSLGSWSPECNDNSSPAISSSAIANNFIAGSNMMRNSFFSAVGGAESSFDLNEYKELQHNEDCFFEIIKQRQKIESGSLILCGRSPW